jgi:iron complex transport system substrate-binding protein
MGDVRKVAAACGVARRGERLAAELSFRLAALSARARQSRPRVAVIEWLAPPMLAGHWVPEVIEAAGGIAVGPVSGEPSPYVGWTRSSA